MADSKKSSGYKMKPIEERKGKLKKDPDRVIKIILLILLALLGLVAFAVIGFIAYIWVVCSGGHGWN
jgi:lipopolysaccharide/colanic/teichoic acid biosynthesis glycosyltransferase